MLDKDLRELLALFRSRGVEFLDVGGHAVAFHEFALGAANPPALAGMALDAVAAGEW